MKALGALTFRMWYLFWSFSPVSIATMGSRSQFSEAHYWNIGRFCLLDLIEIGKAVPPPGHIEDFSDKHRWIDRDKIVENKAACQRSANNNSRRKD